MSLMVITKKFGYSYIIKEKIAGDIFVYIYIYLCNMCIFSNGPLFFRELQSSERGIIIMITIYTNLIDRNAR
jgi:hypothetical protein